MTAKNIPMASPVATVSRHGIHKRRSKSAWVMSCHQ
jgi:hypothetical protein